MVNYTHIIWDWNGTLLNDISASLASVNDMLALRGKPPMNIDYYRECISVPIIGFYEKAFDMENEDYNLIIKQYNEGYLRHLDECKLTDGVVEVIDYFEKQGSKQAVISSSNNNQLIQNVTKYGIFDRFDAVLGAEDFYAGSKIERAENYLKNSGENCRYRRYFSRCGNGGKTWRGLRTFNKRSRKQRTPLRRKSNRYFRCQRTD